MDLERHQVCPDCGEDNGLPYDCPFKIAERCAECDKVAILPGRKVTWKYQQRGGYGFVFAVLATVVKVCGERVTIDVDKTDGTTVRRIVKKERLAVRW